MGPVGVGKRSAPGASDRDPNGPRPRSGLGSAKPNRARAEGGAQKPAVRHRGSQWTDSVRDGGHPWTGGRHSTTLLRPGLGRHGMGRHQTEIVERLKIAQ